jgi:hypothetical protein
MRKFQYRMLIGNEIPFLKQTHNLKLGENIPNNFMSNSKDGITTTSIPHEGLEKKLLFSIKNRGKTRSRENNSNVFLFKSPITLVA